MQLFFKNSFTLKEPTVLRRKLLPLCLGHFYTLLVHESPYVSSDFGTTNLMNLSFAVAICSRTYEDGRAWIKSDKVIDEMVFWGKTCRGMDFKKEDALFEKYLFEYSKFPKRTSSGNALSCRHPVPLLIAVALFPLVGESRAWNMPMPDALAAWSAAGENRGDESLLSDWQIQAFEIERKKAAAKKEKEKK